MAVISLSDVLEARNRPDASLLSRDDLGRELRTYTFDYEMDGETWGFSILAYSMEDAERRSGAIRSSVKLCGEIHSIIPA